MSQARGRRIGGETRHDDVSRAGRLAGCWYALFDCMGLLGGAQDNPITGTKCVHLIRLPTHFFFMVL